VFAPVVTGCILCQYIVERVVNNVHWAGVLPMYRGGRPDRDGFDSETLDTRYANYDDRNAYDALHQLQERQMKNTLVENAYKQPWSTPPIPAKGYPSQFQYGQLAFTRPHNDISFNMGAKERQLGHVVGALTFLETAVKLRASGKMAARSTEKVANAQAPLAAFTGGSQFAFAGAGKPMYTPFTPVDPAQPGYRSWFSALERQKYSEIYHVADLTLDHVCEAAMPNEFYQHCKKIFDAEGAIVNLISRQFGVQNICRRLQLCGTQSYIAQQIHMPHLPAEGQSPYDEVDKMFTKTITTNLDDIPPKEIRQRANQVYQQPPPDIEVPAPFMLDQRGKPIPQNPTPFP